MSNIVVIGTGMVGGDIVAEAARRGHTVTAANRSGKPVADATNTIVLSLDDTAAVAEIIDNANATIIAVSPDRTGGSTQPLVDAHRNLINHGFSGRVIIVGGAGSLVLDDGTKLVDTPDFPAEYADEAQALSAVLDLYRDSHTDWTVVSPSPVIEPGPATGNITLCADTPVGDHVSTGNFAVAILDEVETPRHERARFTVADD